MHYALCIMHCQLLMSSPHIFDSPVRSLQAMGVLTCATAALSMALTRLLIWLLPRWGMIDKPDFKRHIHTKAVPRGGGIGMIAAFIIVVLGFFGYVTQAGNGLFSNILNLLAPLIILVPLGIIDDKIGLSAKTKFFFQIAAAILAWFLGFRLDGFFAISLPNWLGFIATIIWIVGFINAFNMIDGVDGLASGVGTISAICMAVVAFSQKEYAFAAMLMIFIGALLGFLRYNWHPAKVFMGDSGSMFIGYALAVSGLFLNARLASVASIGVPLLACGIPLLDIILAVWRRLLGTPHVNPITADLSLQTHQSQEKKDITEEPLKGNLFSRFLQLLKRLGQADQRHLHHRLMMYYHKNQRKTVLSIYLLATGMGAIGILCCFLPGHNLLLSLVIILGTFSFIINRLAVIELWRTTELAYHNFQSAQAGVKITYVLNPLVDLFVIVASYYFVAWPSSLRFADLLRYLGILLCTLLITRSYRVFWNYVVSDDYFQLICVLFLGFALARISDFIITPQSIVIPRLHLYAAGLAVSVILLERLGIHFLRNSVARRSSASRLNDTSKIHTLIYGVSPITRFYRNHLFNNIEAAGSEQLVGIIAQTSDYLHSYCFGMKVLGTREDLKRIIDEKHINKLVLTIPLSLQERQTLQSFCQKKKLSLTEFSCQETSVNSDRKNTQITT